MKVSERWLREWVDPKLGAHELADALTLAGLECEGVEPAGGEFTNVVVGKVTGLEPHPNADKLQIATVDAGEAEPLTIVCGAPNVLTGMKAPVARVGARLPGGIRISATRLRGQPSNGMLCSARELELSQDAAGLMALSDDAPVGAALDDYLGLDDNIIELDLTPNRGDCLSVRGIARDLGAITAAAVTEPDIKPVNAEIEDVLPIEVEDNKGCPRYAGRVIRGIDPDAVTPLWMGERLRRAGLRPIHPVVDVTNYVLLELGQPLHGFDLANLEGGIVVRRARDKERLALLDGSTVDLNPETLVIADRAGSKAIAGVMGGEGSGVQPATHDVFFESAFFTPAAVAGRARQFGLHTDASHRYERGVDPELPTLALERATELLLRIAGGRPGPISVVEDIHSLPVRQPCTLRRRELERVLALDIEAADVSAILTRLGFAPQSISAGWTATPPSARFDIEGEHDLIEEVGRIIGYDQIPAIPLPTAATLEPVSATRTDERRLRAAMVDRGYQEVVTYSFTLPALENLLGLGAETVALANPLSSDLSQLRRSLWPGLLKTLRHNLNQQQSRVRIFEIGVKFTPQSTDITEETVLSGLVYGDRWPEQWSDTAGVVDFYDAKGDLEAVLGLGAGVEQCSFKSESHPALHPGRGARIYSRNRPVGWLGELHPLLTSELELDQAPILFEVDVAFINQAEVSEYQPFSRYPRVRRDMAVVVDEAVPARDLETLVMAAAGDLLRELRIFDIYRGPGIDSGRKSIALGLILQGTSRTLTDNDLETVIQRVLSQLREELNATLRE